MMEIYYVNSEGEKIDFLSEEYSLQTGDLFNWSWEYKSQNESVISGFKRMIAERKLLFSFRGKSREACYENVNRFIAVIETDILQMKPGALYVGDWYLRCYISQGEMSDWEMDYGCIDCECTLVMDKAVWIRQQNHSFYIQDDNEQGSDLDFPFDYPFDFSYAPGGESITNNHYGSVDFRMTIYGPCISPRVTIGTHPYQIYTEVEENEYLVINSREHTVYRVRNDGSQVNEFNNRQKYPAPSVFDKIPTGKQTVAYTGFSFDLTLLLERSEPEWK